ncbi:hypothetical protein BDW66DRAFT_129740 [Aspergillus desertorum]
MLGKQARLQLTDRNSKLKRFGTLLHVQKLVNLQGSRPSVGMRSRSPRARDGFTTYRLFLCPASFLGLGLSLAPTPRFESGSPEPTVEAANQTAARIP